MANSDHRIYVHFVWTTKYRQPTLSAEVERAVHRIIEAEAKKLGCQVIAINGTEDHIHVLALLGSQLAASKLMNQFKGVTSRFVNENSTAETSSFAGWQRGYGAYSVGANQVNVVANYIGRQKERHANNAIWASLEPVPDPPRSAQTYPQTPH